MDTKSPDVRALVLTHRRPQQADALVRSLITDEGLPPGHIHLVVNGWGGLKDQQLQGQLHTLHLPDNLGPAGGLNRGLRWLCERFQCRWIYVCEDDVPLDHMRIPRVRSLVSDVEAYEA